MCKYGGFYFIFCKSQVLRTQIVISPTTSSYANITLVVQLSCLLMWPNYELPFKSCWGLVLPPHTSHNYRQPCLSAIFIHNPIHAGMLLGYVISHLCCTFYCECTCPYFPRFLNFPFTTCSVIWSWCLYYIGICFVVTIKIYPVKTWTVTQLMKISLSLTHAFLLGLQLEPAINLGNKTVIRLPTHL